MTNDEKRQNFARDLAAAATSVAVAGLGPHRAHFQAEGTRQERVLLVAGLTGQSRTRAETIYNDLCGLVQQTVCRERRTRNPWALDQAWAILRGVILRGGDIPAALALIDEWLALPYEDQRPDGSRVVDGWAMTHSKGRLTAEELRRGLTD